MFLNLLRFDPLFYQSVSRQAARVMEFPLLNICHVSCAPGERYMVEWRPPESTCGELVSEGY